MSRETTQLMWVWSAMKNRCENPNDPAYKNYGGRGITVCERWHTFSLFLADMQPRPVGGMLDRIDNNGPYSPDNCKWSTRKEQNSNRRNCIMVVLDGEPMTLKEACRRRSLTYRAVHKRITMRGWSIERSLSEPIRSMPSPTSQSPTRR